MPLADRVRAKYFELFPDRRGRPCDFDDKFTAMMAVLDDECYGSDRLHLIPRVFPAAYAEGAEPQTTVRPRKLLAGEE